MISLNAIVTRLQTFAESHYFIQKFTYGNPDELDIEKLGSYPALHVVYNGADYDEGTKTYNFELYLIDLPDNKLEDVEQRKEIASDAEQCLEDILADIAAGGNVFYLAEDYEVTSSSVLPIYKANSNVIAGALLDISIQVPHDRSACNLPIDGVEPQGGEFAYARRGLLRMLTINGATDVLSVNTIRVPNGTLVDNGNGDVTLTISGAGGGDVSSVNDVEPDLNGNVALDTDDIPEGVTNEYYTNARVDARIASASVTDLSDVTNAGSGAIITSAERTKLNGIETGAQVNVATDLTHTASALTLRIESSTGSDTILTAASATLAGVMTSSDRTKLDGIETGAEVNPTASEIKTAYESNADTNAYTDAEKSKLAGIAAGAEVNVNADWNATSGDAAILNKPTIPAQFFGVLASGSTAYTLNTPDAGRYLRFTASSAVSVTIPVDKFQTDDEIVIEQAGTGQVEIIAASGVTLNNSSANTKKTAERYAVIALKCVATNVFTLTGERELV